MSLPHPAVAIALSLGSNVGDARLLLRRAVGALAPVLAPLEVAPLYRTHPLAPVPQPFYLNTAVVGSATLEPEDLLALLKALEWRAGRRPGRRHGPRPLDLDLLLYGDRVVESPELTLPHPRLRDRRFVLAPLADLRPGLRVPPEGTTVAELLAGLRTDQEVERVPWEDPAPEEGQVR